MKPPLRGEIWMADLDPTQGREQAGRRPVLIVSADAFNAGPADLIVVAPITSKAKGIRSHVLVEPGTTGLRTKSYVIAEQPRTISKDRLLKRLGAVPQPVMADVELWLRVLLEL